MILFLGHFGPLLSSSLKPNHHKQVKIIQIPDTHCIRNLRWTCFKEVRWLFSSHFWPLLKCVFIFWKQLGSSKNWLKLNRQIKVSLYKSLFLCLFYCFVNRHGWGVVYTVPLKTTDLRKKGNAFVRYSIYYLRVGTKNLSVTSSTDKHNSQWCSFSSEIRTRIR